MRKFTPKPRYGNQVNRQHVVCVSIGFLLLIVCLLAGPPPKPAESLLVATPLESQTTNKSPVHHCLNADFQPVHKLSIWTMLNDNPQYVQGAIKLGRAIKRHTTTPQDTHRASQPARTSRQGHRVKDIASRTMRQGKRVKTVRQDRASRPCVKTVRRTRVLRCYIPATPGSNPIGVKQASKQASKR